MKHGLWRARVLVRRTRGGGGIDGDVVGGQPRECDCGVDAAWVLLGLAEHDGAGAAHWRSARKSP